MQSFTALIVAMAVSGATVPVNTSLDMAGSSDSALASEAGGGPEGLAEQALFEAETHAVAAEPGSTELAIWPDRAHTFGSLEQHQVRCISHLSAGVLCCAPIACWSGSAIVSGPDFQVLS